MTEMILLDPQDQHLRPARLKRAARWMRSLTISAAFLFALVLSAVSFWTTWVGLNEFLAPKVPVSVETSQPAAPSNAANTKTGKGDEAVIYRSQPDAQSRFLSAGTTFGIQGLMFVISIMLGRHLIRMRPMERPGLRASLAEARNGNGANATPGNGERAIRIIFALLGSLFALMALWRMLALPGLAGLLEPSAWSSWLAGTGGAEGRLDSRTLAWLVLSLGAFWRAGIFRPGWAGMVTGFLLFVYLGTMAVSSTFSFDAYYRFLRSAAELRLESRAIVGEETADIVLRTSRLIEEDVQARERELRLLPEQASQKAALAGLTASISGHEEALDRETDMALQRQKEARAAARSQAADEAERIALADAEIARLEAHQSALEAEATMTQGNIARLESEIDELAAEIEPYRAARQEARGRMDLEETGADGRQGGRGKKWEAARKDFAAADEFIRLRESRIDIRRQDVAAARERLAAIAGELAAIPGLTARQQAIRGVAPQAADGNEPAGSKPGEPGMEPPVPVTVLASAVERAWTSFEQEPTKSHFNQYARACNELTARLSRAAPDDPEITSFQCTPPELASVTSGLFAAQEARNRFDRACGATGLQSLRNAANEQAFAVARNCIVLSGLTGREIAGLSNRLTQLISVHSVDGHDFRRSIENLKRGEPYALGAAFGAVFVDMLILVVGMIAAMLFQSPLISDYRALTAEEVQDLILEVLDLYSPGNRPAAARHLLRLMESDPSPDYPLRVTVARLGPQDRILMNGLVAMGRTFIEPRKDGAVFAIHINLARLLYDVAAQARPVRRPEAGPTVPAAAAAAAHGKDGARIVTDPAEILSGHGGKAASKKKRKPASSPQAARGAARKQPAMPNINGQAQPEQRPEPLNVVAITRAARHSAGPASGREPQRKRRA